MVNGMRRESGFTLIELLVVLAIVALLLTLAAPRVMPRIDVAKETILADNLRVTRAVIDQFYADTGSYPDSLEQLVEKNICPTFRSTRLPIVEKHGSSCLQLTATSMASTTSAAGRLARTAGVDLTWTGN